MSNNHISHRRQYPKLLQRLFSGLTCQGLHETHYGIDVHAQYPSLCGAPPRFTIQCASWHEKAALLANGYSFTGSPERELAQQFIGRDVLMCRVQHTSIDYLSLC